MKGPENKADPRRASRELLCQAAYRIAANPSATLPEAVKETMQHFAEAENPVVVDIRLAEDIGGFWEKGGAQADRLLAEVTGGEMVKIAPMEQAVLRLAAVEMINRVGIPPAVVINEWMEVVKRYGTERSHTLVNAVLDQLRKKLAAGE